jgi:hypothetical protein
MYSFFPAKPFITTTSPQVFARPILTSNGHPGLISRQLTQKFRCKPIAGTTASVWSLIVAQVRSHGCVLGLVAS